MSKTLEEIEKDVKQLTFEERQQLLEHLLEEKNSVEKAWLEEADRRWEEIESGKIKTVPGRIVRSEARSFINE